MDGKQTPPRAQTANSTSFFTEPKLRRPQTSHIAHNKSLLKQQFILDPDIDPSQRLKSIKHQLKYLQKQYNMVLSQLNDSKKVIDHHYRSSQKKKVQFLNLYQHRKLKLTEQKLLEERRGEKEKAREELRERAKTMKLNGEVRTLLLRNEVEESNSQLCSRNRIAKQVTIVQGQRMKEQIARRRGWQLQAARRSYARVKASEGDLVERRRRIGEMQMWLGRSNYLHKVDEEVALVQRLDKLLGGVQEQGFYRDFQQGELFLTQKQ